MIDGVNIFVAGQTGSGKTELVKRSLADVERLIVYLPKREDTGYPGVYFDALIGSVTVGVRDLPGQTQFYNGGERDEFLRFWLHSKDHCNRFRLVYRPADKYNAEEFDSICRLVSACGDCVFIAEEIASYLTTRIFQATGKYQGIKNLLTAGRTRGVTCWWITQRCFGIPREVTSEARDAYLFKLQEPADLDYVQDRFGLAARLSMDQLQEYQHVHWINTGKVEVAKA
jgi:hypothetical protein